MYSDSEIQVSRDHLERVLTSLEGPLVLLGGWAVFIQVNGPFKEATGREYLGSRDIDLDGRIRDERFGRVTEAHWSAAGMNRDEGNGTQVPGSPDETQMEKEDGSPGGTGPMDDRTPSILDWA